MLVTFSMYPLIHYTTWVTVHCVSLLDYVITNESQICFPVFSVFHHKIKEKGGG